MLLTALYRVSRNASYKLVKKSPVVKSSTTRASRLPRKSRGFLFPINFHLLIIPKSRHHSIISFGYLLILAVTPGIFLIRSLALSAASFLENRKSISLL